MVKKTDADKRLADAMLHSDLAAAQTALDFGADIFRSMAVWYAVRSDDIKNVAFLREHGGPEVFAQFRKENALAQAVEQDNLPIFELLLADNLGLTSDTLFYALGTALNNELSNQIAFIDRLLAANLDLNSQHGQSLTCATADQPKVLEKFLKAGASPDAISLYSYEPKPILFTAIESKNEQAVFLLLAAGADIAIRPPEKKLSLTHHQENNSPTTVDALITTPRIKQLVKIARIAKKNDKSFLAVYKANPLPNLLPLEEILTLRIRRGFTITATDAMNALNTLPADTPLTIEQLINQLGGAPVIQ